jgi:hypothetical protein
MAELQDYSGEFKHDLRFEDFSKEALVKLIKAYCRCFVGIMGCWNTVDRQRLNLSLEEGQEIVGEVYKLVADTFEFPMVTKAMNIHGNDVVSMLKLFQVLPDGNHGALYKAIYDIKSKDHVIVTFTTCPSLGYYEKHGLDKTMELCCGKGGTEEQAFVEYARLVNPKIRVKGLKFPPRKSPDEIACKWEFWTEK